LKTIYSEWKNVIIAGKTQPVAKLHNLTDKNKTE